MKVAIVVPTYNYNNAYPTLLTMNNFPVGLAYIASALKKAGHDVIGLNLNNDSSYPSASIRLHDKMKKMLEDDRPQLIALGGLCSDYAFIKDALPIIRKYAPSVPVVCGGGIITNDPEFIFSELKPDFCIIGEGEENLVQLAEFLTAGKTSFETIPNLGYWQDGVAKFSEPGFNYPPLETRPFPDYSPFNPESMLANSISAGALFRYTRSNPRIMPFIAARGCPFKCTFCVHHKNGPKYRTRPMSDILEEIAQLYEKYQFNILIMMDELFAIDKIRLQELCDGIMDGRKKLGWDFDWLFQTHANANLGHRELTMAKEAGCYYFSYGMESASPTVLASMNKKSRPEQISEAIRLATEVGIGFGGNFIFGDIAETPETAAETLDFYVKYCKDISIYFTAISPYPGSDLFNHCLKHGIIKDKRTYYETLDKTLYNMTGMPERQWGDFIMSLILPLGLSIPLAVTVEPFEVVLDTSPRKDDVVNPIWRIKAQCPHCKVTRDFREPLSREAVAGGSAVFLTGCSSCGKLFKIAAKGEGRFLGEFTERSFPVEIMQSLIDKALLALSNKPVERKALDLGCGTSPKNPYQATEVHGVGSMTDIERRIHCADLAIDGIPFPNDMFDFVTAYQLIEQIPKVVYLPERRNSFVELMNEIYRVLKVDGIFLSVTAAYPNSAAFKDPTTVNIISEETFPQYFDDTNRKAEVYGFTGHFKILKQEWMGENLVTQMRKILPDS